MVWPARPSLFVRGSAGGCGDSGGGENGVGVGGGCSFSFHFVYSLLFFVFRCVF